jgi:predicted ATPase
MLREMRIKNFKCFQNETQIPIERLNLYTGSNGSGKSTALQPLLCLKQTMDKLPSSDRIYFNGNSINIGSFKDAKNVNTPRSEKILFHFGFDFDDNFIDIEYYFKEDEADDLSAPIINIMVEGKLNGKNFEFVIKNENKMAKVGKSRNTIPFYMLFVDKQKSMKDEIDFGLQAISNLQRIHYISADRIGPRAYYPRESFGGMVNVGNRGQYAIHALDIKKQERVSSHLLIDQRAANTVLDQVDAWLNWIFSGGKLDIRQLEANVISLLMNADGSANYFKPTNMGFGYSYALPILVSGLIAENGDILIVENPEAHLIPKAQSRIAQFLSKVSLGGVQVFIESHSEHILNGIRVEVKSDRTIAKKTAVIFFQGLEKTSLSRVIISESGKIHKWPEGFFDQSEIDFEKIHGDES